MRLFLGVGVLFVGLLGIGYFGGHDRALEIEQKVKTNAEGVLRDLEAQAMLDAGQITVSVAGRDLVLSGFVESDREEVTVLASFQDVQGVRDLRSNVTLPPIAAPYMMRLDRSGTIAGNVPTKAARAALAGNLGLATEDSLILSRGAPDEAWTKAVVQTAQALPYLEEGQIVIIDQQVNVEGKVIFAAGLEAVEDELAQLPQGYTSVFNVEVLDDGQPFSLYFERKDDVLTAISGKLPADTASDAFTTIPRGYMTDADGAFGKALAAGLSLLTDTQVNSLLMSENKLELSALVDTPQSATALQNQLQSALPDHAITMALDLRDDGLPAFMSLRHSAQDGVSIDGKLPTELQTWLKNEAGLGPVRLEDSVYDAIFEPQATAPMQEMIENLSPWTAEFEHLQARFENGAAAIEGIATYGVDVAQLAQEMQTAMPQAQISLRAADPASAPQSGALRAHAVTRQEQVFYGAWLPNVWFEAGVESCDAASSTALDQRKINFVTGSARLDARSMRAINALGAIIHNCVKSNDLEVLITGHTDNQGAPEANQKLSEERARAVGAALLQREIAADVLRIFGAGDTKPIADNATPEGRAANRRTSITWRSATTTSNAQSN